MSQTSLADLRAALGSALESVEGLSVKETIGGAYNPPFAVLLVRDIPEPRETCGRDGIIALPLTVMVFVARADDELAQRSLDEYLDWVGESSISAALERDQTLGGIADSVTWESFRLLGAEEVAGYGYFGGEFIFTIRAPRERS